MQKKMRYLATPLGQVIKKKFGTVKNLCSTLGYSTAYFYRICASSDLRPSQKRKIADPLGIAEKDWPKYFK